MVCTGHFDSASSVLTAVCKVTSILNKTISDIIPHFVRANDTRITVN